MTQNASSRSTQSTPEDHGALRSAYSACRQGTEALFADLDDETFRRQPHPDFSPAGWHLGHIAYTEAKWLLCHAGGEDLPHPELKQTFDVAGLPKSERGESLPDKPAVLDYAAEIRERTWGRLDGTDLKRDGRLWQFVLQHESQHGETVAFLRYLMGDRAPMPEGRLGPMQFEYRPVPGGPVKIGYDNPAAIDNERPCHTVEVPDFAIARYPVTQYQYLRFIETGGYNTQRWWSDAGWAWRRQSGANGPLYWRHGVPDHPVMGVSLYEAEAFARFAGARLPTEFEWEKAAAWDPAAETARRYPWGNEAPEPTTCNHDRIHRGTTPVDVHPQGASPYGVEDMIGNVWEWTSTAFAPYPDFRAWPYEGYSAVYFDGKHFVLRGGSWATRPWSLRASFRNWYVPEARQIFAGFRLARDLTPQRAV